MDSSPFGGRSKKKRGRTGAVKCQKKERAKKKKVKNLFAPHPVTEPIWSSLLYGNTDRSRYPCTQNVFHSIHDARAQFVRVFQRPILEQQDRDLLRDDDDGESDAENFTVVSAASVGKIKFDGSSAGEANLDLKVARSEVAKGIVHKYVVMVRQNARRVSVRSRRCFRFLSFFRVKTSFLSQTCCEEDSISFAFLLCTRTRTHHDNDVHSFCGPIY